MKELKHTSEELKQWQGFPLSVKVLMTVERIRNWINEFGEDGVYVSFSGGKDSTVLLDIVRKNFGEDIKAVFCNTGLEFPDIVRFVKRQSNIEIIKPKMNFKEVICKYGYPMISKEVSECVQGARKYLNTLLADKAINNLKREDQKCIYCDNLLGKKGCLGMCNKHYIQYKRWGDPLHADKKERATIDGYYRDGKTGRREHRVIYENHYGIKLKDEEIIHHINFVKTDNNIENLYKYNNASEHIKAHREFERLMESLTEEECICFEDGHYVKREREREREHSDRQPPYKYFYDKLCETGKYEKSEQGGTTTSIVNSEELASILNDRMLNRRGGNNQRLAQMLGMLTNGKTTRKIMANIPDKDRSRYSAEKYKFLLFAPFNISNQCCNVMKKSPAHKYAKSNKRMAITAQMASESRLRTQKWLQYGCNMYDATHPKSNPMSFWTEQDVLNYIKEHNLPISKAYGEVVEDISGTEEVRNQYTFSDMAGVDTTEFDAPKCPLSTTLCKRTGCIFCGFGATHDPERFALIDVVTGNTKLRDYCMRGGEFDEYGLWQPTKHGLGMWFVLKYINIYGNFKVVIPEYDRYEKEYGNELTYAYLYENKRFDYSLLAERERQRLKEKGEKK